MTTPDPLLLQFASTRPMEVGELISDYAPDEVNDFLADLPGTVAARICAHMSSRALSELLEYLQPAITGRMLLDGEHSDVLTLVSHLHRSQYDRVLDTVEGGERAQLSRLFDFPGQTLSALASTNFLRVQAETLCGDVADELMAGDETTELPLFVVDDTGGFIGIVTTQTVISKRHQNKPVSDYIKPVEPLPGSMTAATALNASQWLTESALPVVDSDRQIIGAITREELAKVARESADGDEPGLEDIFSELSVRYLDLCANVVSLVFKYPKDREE